MAWFFLVSGLLLVTAAINNSHCNLFDLLKADFTGPNNFFYWVLAIVILVSLGSIKQIRPMTDAFLALVILVIVLVAYKNNTNLFQYFMQQVRNGTRGE